jgi:bifunctional DNA-binding transcriptional regulator/antitoxin component of YhaV-PrlF toxin-antitoxin module
VQTFRAKLEPVPHGGQYVVVPAEVADAAGLKHGARVRGEVNGVGYRSSLMKYSGIFHLGVHKATLETAGVKPGARVSVTIECDDEPLPTDVVPDDLAVALKKNPSAANAWTALAPSHKREHVKALLSAKLPDTRARRVVKILAALMKSL